METSEVNNMDLRKESLDSLTEKLSELNNQPFPNREEKRKIMAEMDKKIKWEAEKSLALFIASELDKGGPLNTTAIRKKARELEIFDDITHHINRVISILDIQSGESHD